MAARLDCASQDDAQRVRDTMHAAIALARNELDEARRQAASESGDLTAAIRPLFGLADDALSHAKLTTEQSQVRFGLEIDLNETALAPAVAAACEAAKSSQAMNNLKQIALGLNIYYDIHGHFPPPIVIGPDGKTPHSWRVAILPCIEQVPLFNQYKLDEPWDSDNNKRVLAQMPSTYRHPNAAAGTLETSYFALVGEATALGPKGGQGTKVAEITDGMSNTVAVVEAKRSVLWTKPEDIAYDASEPLPALGGWLAGGFFAALCDGSVRFFKDATDPEALRASITKAGRE